MTAPSPAMGAIEAGRVGAAIEAAWNGSGSGGKPNDLPPIELTPHERQHLGAAALAEARRLPPSGIIADEALLADLERLKLWCRSQDARATIWLHIDEAIRALNTADRDRSYAIRWANQSVDMLKDAFFPVANALRALEGYVRDTPHHNAPEAAAARQGSDRRHRR